VLTLNPLIARIPAGNEKGVWGINAGGTFQLCFLFGSDLAFIVSSSRSIQMPDAAPKISYAAASTGVSEIKLFLHQSELWDGD
jgi:hypothetical protein